MPKLLKWVLIVGGVLVVLAFAVSILTKTPFWDTFVGVLSVSALLVFFVGASILGHGAERKRVDRFRSLLSQSWVSSLPLLEAFERVKHQIAVSHIGTNWWVLRVANPDAGYVVAMIQFPQGEGTACQMVLHVRLSPVTDGEAETEVRLGWEVTYHEMDGTIKILEQMNGALRKLLA
jgi:hypothetical protein